ncbi:mediator complex subunit MED14-domain-containing protein [Tricladium varicosporioides]|nr:mediator complex subunit MED14-domain-containing protein [Hymenoscyphus varicosporioides]
MDSGARNGSHTNHDRDPRLNGINGANAVSEKALDKGKNRSEPQQNVTPISPTIPNGVNGAFSQARQNGAERPAAQGAEAKFDQLPQEIKHITAGYLPVSTLLSRLAQKTHNNVEDLINQLAGMPVPASVASSNASTISTADDNGMENLKKKLTLINFAQSAHEQWTKALIITNWSRRSEDVSKMIDLRIHLTTQKVFYDQALDNLVKVKRDLSHARLPNPDLKTALEVLTTGRASWMPELGYVPPPLLTAKEILQSLENLNTLLSIRLNLHEYDKIPWYFRDYTIKSGRVTFRVEGEFEVDLTIADEDPESQFWFIDFRFLFSPTSLEIPLHLQTHIENRVNEALLQDGLLGCYNYLHSVTLTHKISEFRRQAASLARGKWVESLKVESLNRALSVQYWVDRYTAPHFGPNPPKSWIILGVHSGKRKTGQPHPKDTSRLFIRWFRDSKEVLDADITFDTMNLSMESLLKKVIAKHVEYMLTSNFKLLEAQPLYRDHESLLALSISSDDPTESEMNVQLTNERHLSVRMEPITGRFIFSPASRINSDSESKLNNQAKAPAIDGYKYIESLRHFAVTEEIVSRAVSLGWIRVDNPGLKQDDLRAVVPKDTSQVVWLRRNGWKKNWFVAISLSMSGERWWLIETTDPPASASIPQAKNARKESNINIANHLFIPIKAMSPIPTYHFLNTLHIFITGILSHYANLKALHAKRALFTLHGTRKLLTAVRLPSIYVRLSSLIKFDASTSSSKDIVKLTFQGLEALHETSEARMLLLQRPDQQPTPSATVTQGLTPKEDKLMVVTEARINLAPSAMRSMAERIDRDIAFDSEKGFLALRLRSRIGESVIPSLIERALRVQRLVNFVTVLHKHEKSIECENISLGKIIFTYPVTTDNRDAMDVDGATTQSYKAIVDFSASDNDMKLVLEKGNPQLLIVDHLTRLLNGKEGLDSVATLLPLSLPVVRSLDAVEVAWASVSKAIGDVFVFVRAIDWYIIRYSLASTASLPSGVLKISFEIKLRQRRGVPWWYIIRIDNRGPGDELDNSLRSVWNLNGPGWQGMRVSAVAQRSGVEELVGKIDDVVRTFANNGGANTLPNPSQPAPQPTPQAVAPINGPSSRPQMTSQQPRQQPTPNQSQQSQGRSNPIKREIVEID